MKKVALVFIPLCLLSTLSNAALIIDPSYTPQWTSNDNSNFNAIDVANLVGSPTVLEELYKADVATPVEESGLFTDSYNTEFFNTSTDPDSALITWSGPSFIGCPVCYLLVKDGNHSPAQYVFDIGGWDGMMDIELNNFWPQNGAISHIAIYGGVKPPNEEGVPEPGTVVLFGMGLLGIGLSQLRKKRRVL